MKTTHFVAIAIALGLSSSLQAQQPGPAPDRPKDPPPAPPPVVRPDAQHRDPDRGPGPQARSDVQRAPHHAASGPEREAHIREALKHLREAGLGDMAERIEQAIGERHRGHDRRDGSHPDVARGPRTNPPSSDEARRPEERRHQRHPHWADERRRDKGDAFAAPQRIPNPRPDSARNHPQQRHELNSGMEQLRSQVDRLTREVEALKNLMKQRTPEPPREQIRRPDERKTEERRGD